MMFSHRFALAACVTLVFGAPLHAAPITAFLEQHCTDCHDDTLEKGGLDLTALPTGPEAFAEPKHAMQWVKVYDRLAANEMPPAKKPRPAANESQRALTWIKTALNQADTVRRAREGRVVLRRLNRVEYENTVRDLFAIDADLKDYLPEDNELAGFDNVGAALSLSSVLMERYLEAADAALDAAIVHHPKPEVTKKRYSYKDNERVTKNKKIFRVVDDAVVFFSSGYSPTALGQFRAPADGRYRVRISAYGYQSDEPVTFRVYAGNVIGREGKKHLVGYYDVPPDKPTVVEFEDRFLRTDSVRIVPHATGFNIYQIGATKYEDPGLAVQWVEIEGPFNDAWPPESHRRVYGDLPLKEVKADPRSRRRGPSQLEVVTTEPLPDAERIIRRLLPKAYRRPITDADVAPIIALVESRLEQGYGFEEALRVGLKAMLCSPSFLYFHEKPGRLTDHALASRLSYFLWNSMPDDTLFALADKGQLRRPEVLRQQVERMLRDPRAARFTENFVGQWLDLRDIDFTTPDRKLYPEFDELLQVSMVAETQAFFDELLDRDLSVLNVVDSDFGMLNERLARHYGVEGVRGQAIRRVNLPAGSRRGGVLTHASVLKVTANGTNTSPVLRGIWVLENILGQPSPPPPANVPAVEPDIRGTTTIRDQLAKHREVASCAVCHNKIDPPGFALESFDVIGGWRTEYRSVGEGERVNVKVNDRHVQYRKGLPVDASGKTPDGRRFDDIDGFKKLILQDKDQVARCVAGKLVTYATGAPVGFGDRAAVEAIVAQAREKAYGLRSMVHAVVQSRLFLEK